MAVNEWLITTGTYDMDWILACGIKRKWSAITYSRRWASSSRQNHEPNSSADCRSCGFQKYCLEVLRAGREIIAPFELAGSRVVADRPLLACPSDTCHALIRNSIMFQALVLLDRDRPKDPY